MQWESDVSDVSDISYIFYDHSDPSDLSDQPDLPDLSGDLTDLVCPMCAKSCTASQARLFCHCSHHVQLQRQNKSVENSTRVLSPRPNLQRKHSCGSGSPGTSRTSPCLRRSGRLLRAPSRRGKCRSPIARTIPAGGRNKTKTESSARSRGAGGQAATVSSTHPSRYLAHVGAQGNPKQLAMRCVTP